MQIRILNKKGIINNEGWIYELYVKWFKSFIVILFNQTNIHNSFYILLLFNFCVNEFYLKMKIWNL